MFNIGDYLKKFANIEGDSLALKQAVSETLKNFCGAEIDFEFKKGIIYIKGSSTGKSVAYTKKSAILASLREKYPKFKVSDIR